MGIFPFVSSYAILITSSALDCSGRPERPPSLEKALRDWVESGIGRFIVVFVATIPSMPNPCAIEIVLLISMTGEPASEASQEQIDAYLREHLPKLGAKGAANEAARKYGKPKRELYARAVELQKSEEP